MDNTDHLSDEEFASLPEEERARIISVTRLLKHFRGLERSGLLKPDEAGKYIGSIRILEALAKGEFVPR